MVIVSLFAVAKIAQSFEQDFGVSSRFKLDHIDYFEKRRFDQFSVVMTLYAVCILPLNFFSGSLLVLTEEYIASQSCRWATSIVISECSAIKLFK